MIPVAPRDWDLSRATSKVRQNGCHRIRLPAETFHLIESRLLEFGITRVANVTGLDRIGIPVYIAIRPNSRSLAVSQGKGVDLVSAKVSAVMESIELWHAERATCPIILKRWNDFTQDSTALDPLELPLSRDSWYDPRRIIPWTKGVDIVTDEGVWVPFELVHADATVPRMPGSGCFLFTTNGLASGNTLPEAALHGICELIERDAIALWKIKSDEEQHCTRLDLGTVNDPICTSLLQKFASAGILVMAWDATSDIDVAVSIVQLFDTYADETIISFAPAFGAGCHPEPSVSLCRALTEAAQSRLTAITGSRDDGTRRIYQAAHGLEAFRYFSVLARNPGNASFRGTYGPPRKTVEEDLRFLLGRIQSIGLTRVVVVDLSREDSPVAVVRCIIPGLEGPSSSPSYRPGKRGKALANN